MNWNISQDCLSILLPSLPIPLTKRQLLRCIASVYDPLGLISPFLMVGKLLFKDLWISGSKWDTPLEDCIQKKVSNWWNSIENLSSLSVER